MTFMTDFIVKRYGSREEFKFELDTEIVLGKDLKKLLEPLIGVPVEDQLLAYEGELMKDEESLLDGSLQVNTHKVIVSSKSQTHHGTCIEPPPDWNAEKNPMFESLVRYMEQHYSKEDISTLCYHMSQYVRELCDRTSFDHLEILAKKNIEEYDTMLRGRRKHYYEFFERCIYLERRMKESDSQMESGSHKALQTAFRAQQEAMARAQREAVARIQQAAIVRAQARKKKQ